MHQLTCFKVISGYMQVVFKLISHQNCINEQYIANHYRKLTCMHCVHPLVGLTLFLSNKYVLNTHFHNSLYMLFVCCMFSCMLQCCMFPYEVVGWLNEASRQSSLTIKYIYVTLWKASAFVFYGIQTTCRKTTKVSNWISIILFLLNL